VLNVDGEPPGRLPAATPDQLDRGRAGEDPETLDQRAIGGARWLPSWKAGAYHRIAFLTNQAGSRPIEKHSASWLQLTTTPWMSTTKAGSPMESTLTTSRRPAKS